MAMIWKKTATGVFLILLGLIALRIPVRAAGLQDPIFYESYNKKFEFLPSMDIFRSSGLGVSNINGRQTIVPVEPQVQDAFYDLRLSFDGNDFYGNYTPIRRNYETNSQQKLSGSTSAKFISEKNDLLLMPKSSALLASSGLSMQSFTIDFWIYPLYSGEGMQTVLDFSGRNRADLTDPKTYGVRISLEKGFVVYNLDNLFRDQNTNLYSFTLRERSAAPRGAWSRHTLVLNASEASLRIYQNGVEHQAEPLTAQKVISGIPLLPNEAIASSKPFFPLSIGKNGAFSLDDISISGDVRTNFSDNLLRNRFLETAVYTVSSNPAHINKMHVNGTFPKESGVRVAYRVSPRYFFASDTVLPWIYINPDQAVFPPSRSLGKYIQWRFEYTPPVANSEPMRLYGLSVDYREDNVPAALKIELLAESRGSVSLAWGSLPDPNVSTYEIYYGTKPGTYFGNATISPSSPVVVPAQQTTISQSLTYTLEGLEDETAYYIIVRARNKYGVLGPPSQEIYARPSAVKSAPHYSIQY
ncbi:MAG: LamG-like jellyroll fold domain-containing protein [Brevinema sp.]